VILDQLLPVSRKDTMQDKATVTSEY